MHGTSLKWYTKVMIHFRSKHLRYLTVLILGALAAIICGISYQWPIAPLIGWDVAALLLVIFVWNDFRSHSPSEIARVARSDDFSHGIMDTIVLIASVMSLGAVAVFMTGKSDSIDVVLRSIIALVSIIISWSTVHTLYSLRYAAMYYNGDKEGGVDFSGSRPRHSDFTYLAFTIGMTYQVSDTTLQTSAFRRVALQQALLSFVFGTAIIATSINLIASIVSK